jgi:hypothetical protein
MIGRSLALALLLLAGVPALGVADEVQQLEELVVKMAATPEHHRALAEYYRGKAEAARKEGARHRAMGKAYGGTKVRERAMMQTHCDQIASSQEALAKQYEELAQLHEAEAGAQ